MITSRHRTVLIYDNPNGLIRRVKALKDNKQNAEKTKIYVKRDDTDFRHRVADKLAVTRMFEGVSQAESAGTCCRSILSPQPKESKTG